MCGIVGVIGQRPSNFNEMLASQVRRGPDASNIWSEHNITLGHNRLAIIDLSSHGAQPQQSHSERYVITYNGEIYNFLTLKAELESIGVTFLGHSDTEILLALIENHGLDSALEKIEGMFAFGLWDKVENILYLVRDRFGEKPLYYGRVGSRFVFASELKPFTLLEDWNPMINKSALSYYMHLSYIPSPHSIYDNIYKLEPGCYLSVTHQGQIKNKVVYWNLESNITKSINNQFKCSETDAINILEEKLTNSINQRLVADVPVGAFLSGGIDSSLIVALAQKAVAKPVKTFTVGFKDKSYNEAEYANKIAKRLGTEHTEVYLSEADALEVVAHLPDFYDEPFSDSSQIPKYLVSKVARQHVTVALSGDAGDELFGGYNRYIYAQKLYKIFFKLPFIVRRQIGKTLDHIARNNPNFIDRYIGKTLGINRIGEKLIKLARVLSKAKDQQDIYAVLIDNFSDDNQELLINTVIHLTRQVLASLNNLDWMMLQDTAGYLPGDILTKVDRAAMANSLETRIPFLDREVFEFAWQLPDSLKINGQQSKWILRQLLYRYVPHELIDRPKMGFAVPVGRWLRQDLKTWAHSLLDSNILIEQGYLSVSRIKSMWEYHQSGKMDFSHQLWTILMFQLWLSKYG